MKNRIKMMTHFFGLIILIGISSILITGSNLGVMNSNALVYSTLLGKSELDFGIAIIQDSHGNTIISGVTYSSDFPVTENAWDTTHNGQGDIFVSKISANGSTLLFSTFVGGNANDGLFGTRAPEMGISLDSSENIIIYGLTESSDFPVTSGAYNEVFRGGNTDVFITKLSEDGSEILFSTFLGGTGDEGNSRSISLDDADNIYVSGWTSSSDFPTSSNALNKSFNGAQDVFISKISADGTSLLYSTFLGGTGIEASSFTELDSEDNVYVGGWTMSSDFPTTSNAIDFDRGEGPQTDGFISKLSIGTSSELLFSTYVSGSALTQPIDLVIDSDNNIYITGATGSADLKTTSNAYSNTLAGDVDAFIWKISSTGSLLYGTFLGSNGRDMGETIALDNEKNIYITGRTNSSNFPTTLNAYKRTCGGMRDQFVLKLAVNGSTIAYSSLLGGNGMEPWLFNTPRYYTYIDSYLVEEDSIYMIGSTNSTDFPVSSNALNSAFNGGVDVFVTQLQWSSQESTFTTTTTTTTATTTGTTPWFGIYTGLVILVLIRNFVMVNRGKRRK